MAGEQLQESRKDSGLTQEELGEKLGIGPQMVSRYERGDNLPTTQALITMSELFNVNIDFLLDRTRIRTSWSDYERQLKGKLEQGSETEQECLRLSKTANRNREYGFGTAITSLPLKIYSRQAKCKQTLNCRGAHCASSFTPYKIFSPHLLYRKNDEKTYIKG